MKSILKNGEYDYIKLCSDIRKLKEKYSFLDVIRIGKSSMGKDIFALKIGKKKENVLFAAAFHGSEHITQNIALMFCEELCDALLTDTAMAGINMKAALGERGVVIIPSVNPDGCEISVLGAKACADKEFFIRKLCGGDFSHYNANIRGVDLNHNFDADWKRLHILERKSGILGPASTRYGGPHPESESETKAITEFCRKNSIRHAVALHSQGEVIYWKYGEKTPVRSKIMAEIMATVSDYRLDIPVPLATGGGFKDWFIEEFGNPAFTIELGSGKNPLPISDAEGIYKKAREMLTLAAIM